MRAALFLLLGLLAPQDAAVEKGSCTGRALRPSPDPALQELLAKFEIADKEFAWELKELKAGAKFTVSWLTFPSAVKSDVEENNTVWAKYWRPAGGDERKPAAVVLHWLGGSFEALELVCARMAESGIHALMMYQPHYGPRRSRAKEKMLGVDLEKSMANVRQAVLDARRSGDWLAARPDVDPARVGIVGISLGAVTGSLAAGVDDRFGRSVFVIGGGDVPGILFNGSKEVAAQKKSLEEAGYTPEKLRETWKGVEPCTFASRMRAAEILLINAEEDEVIPKACTMKLHEAIGRPEIKWIKGGHYAIAIQMGVVIRDIVAHLGNPPPKEPGK